MDNIVGTLCIFVILLAASAFFSANETALTGANRVRLRNQEEQGSRSASRALKLIGEYDKTLSTLLIGNNIVNTLLASIATAFCSQLFPSGGVGIATAAVTVLVLVFGEVTPKVYAGAHAEATVKRFAPLVLALKFIFAPFSAALRGLQRLLVKDGEAEPSVTEEELKVIFDQSVDEGVLEEERSELLQNALEFDDILAEEILTPRVDLAAVELRSSRDEVQQVFLEQHFSRLPVYEKDLDHIVGVVSQKDFFAAIVTGSYTDLAALCKPCLYIPPKKPISDLMAELQRSRVHVAVVTDEHGGTSGIVTLEDVLEQLVGEIWDEHDQVVSPLRPQGGERWEADGELSVYTLYETLCEDDPVPETEAATVAGLALQELGRIPEVGDSFTAGRLSFTVTALEGRRIRSLSVTVNEKADPDGAAAEK